MIATASNAIRTLYAICKALLRGTAAILLVCLLLTGCASVPTLTASSAEGEQAARPQPHVTEKIAKLEAQRRADRQQLLEVQAQLADLQRKSLELEAEIDRLEKLVIARYEEFLKEDRQVLNELDQVLQAWIETIETETR